jgi:hypothetical protein
MGCTNCDHRSTVRDAAGTLGARSQVSCAPSFTLSAVMRPCARVGGSA